MERPRVRQICVGGQAPSHQHAKYCSERVQSHWCKRSHCKVSCRLLFFQKRRSRHSSVRWRRNFLLRQRRWSMSLKVWKIPTSRRSSRIRTPFLHLSQSNRNVEGTLKFARLNWVPILGRSELNCDRQCAKVFTFVSLVKKASAHFTSWALMLCVAWCWLHTLWKLGYRTPSSGWDWIHLQTMRSQHGEPRQWLWCAFHVLLVGWAAVGWDPSHPVRQQTLWSQRQKGGSCCNWLFFWGWHT